MCRTRLGQMPFILMNFFLFFLSLLNREKNKSCAITIFLFPFSTFCLANNSTFFVCSHTTISARSHIIDEDETCIYEILQEQHLEEWTRLLADTFATHNPLEVYLKTTYE